MTASLGQGRFGLAPFGDRLRASGIGRQRVRTLPTGGGGNQTPGSALLRLSDRFARKPGSGSQTDQGHSVCYRSAVTPCAAKHELEPIGVLNGERLAVHPQRSERHRH